MSDSPNPGDLERGLEALSDRKTWDQDGPHGVWEMPHPDRDLLAAAASELSRLRLQVEALEGENRQGEADLEAIGAVGRKPIISKHRAANLAHIRDAIARLDRAGLREEADTLVWSVWWRALDAQRERFLVDDANERAQAAEALARQAQEERDRALAAPSNLDLVRAFHTAFGIPILPTPTFPEPERIAMRLRILDEERAELTDAIQAHDIVEVADALTDMAYLVYGTALEFGIDLNPCFREVHRSNMSKLGHDGKPIHREDGKVLKGPNYSRPDLAPLLNPEPRS